MMNTPTLNQDIIQQAVNIVDRVTISQTEAQYYWNEINATTSVVIDPTSSPQYSIATAIEAVDEGFFRSQLKIDRAQNKYLLEYLNRIIASFADRIVIGKKTTILLSTSLTEFLSQPDIREAYSLCEYRYSNKKDWKNRLFIIDFIDFLITRRINCHSDAKCGEFSKLIGCLKIFVLNDLVGSLLNPVRL